MESKYRFLARASAILLILGIAPACFTMITVGDEIETNKIYSGTRANVVIIGSSYDHPHGPGPMFRYLGILDFPFSLVADTLVLPYTIPYTIFADYPSENFMESDGSEEILDDPDAADPEVK